MRKNPLCHRSRLLKKIHTFVSSKIRINHPSFENFLLSAQTFCVFFKGKTISREGGNYDGTILLVFGEKKMERKFRHAKFGVSPRRTPFITIATPSRIRLFQLLHGYKGDRGELWTLPKATKPITSALYSHIPPLNEKRKNYG